MALKVDESSVTAARKRCPATVVTFSQRDESIRPLSMSLDSVMMGGRQVPIIYSTSDNGFRTFRYDEERSEIVMVNLSKSDPRDHDRIKEYILTALCDYGAPDDFWQTYNQARGI